jgi:hypothetical protein
MLTYKIQNTTDLDVNPSCGAYPPIIDDLYVCATSLD